MCANDLRAKKRKRTEFLGVSPLEISRRASISTKRLSLIRRCDHEPLRRAMRAATLAVLSREPPNLGGQKGIGFGCGEFDTEGFCGHLRSCGVDDLHAY